LWRLVVVGVFGWLIGAIHALGWLHGSEAERWTAEALEELGEDWFPVHDVVRERKAGITSLSGDPESS
jgi:hypothetical protein